MTPTPKTWLITGISRGLGKSLAEAVLQQGDIVIGTVCGSRPDIALSPALHILNLDVADPSAIPATIESAFAITGRIDVFGPIRLIRAAPPRLRAQGSGHIINITSITGRAPVRRFTPRRNMRWKVSPIVWHRNSRLSASR